MKLVLKNCAIAGKGQYHSPQDGKLATVIAEAWCDRRLYIWSWFRKLAGKTTDLNLSTFSPIVQNINSGGFCSFSDEPYRILQNGAARDTSYMLVDGIYPSWPIL